MIRFRSNRLLAVAAIAVTTMAPMILKAQDVTIGQTFLASGLDPAEGSNGWAVVSHGVGEQLFRVSREGEVVPNLAAFAVLNDDGTWTIDLATDRFFSDGTPVTAEAVAEGFNRTGESNPSARATAGRLTFTALDANTLSVTTEQPTTILPSILAEWAFPVYKMDGEIPVFTGPFVVTEFEPGGSIEMVPNAHYENAENRPNVTLRRIADGQSMALAFASGELDMAFNLPVESLPMLEAVEGETVSFPVGYQYMMWMNTTSPALSDTRVRQAIDMAINRSDLVTAAQAGVPATGAFAQSFPFAATEELTYDPTVAAALLDEAGWTVSANGVRAKDGVELELVLYAYPQRPDLVTFQPVVRAALAEIGIGVTTQVTDTASELAGSGEFDMFLWATHTAPAGDPGLFLSLFFETDAIWNHSRWSNPDYDALIAELRAEGDPQARIDLALRAQEMIAAEAPVSFLVTPEWHVGLSPALAGYEPWGSDYYVIRPDLVVAE
ncbi:ABC transporter substrate-binding protein [Tateyamaria sp. ANG-S1]|uniref:ABC transporter substrate-binding protein n=1 Tax=Tateyamaria sp. ANG-S1 TaxID=1577905 RepID=UPI00057DC87A|nr:ABC transporter substrate-binding protein [Tateyamaria sp. ANG-S1]KIC46199.1 hypothetical protein RA29_19700 [Tateyamaria sp. ANG-S1]